MIAFRMPMNRPKKTWMTPIVIARMSIGIIASTRFQVIPRNCTG